MSGTVLSIGACAKATGLTVRTLRYWESLGLLAPLRRADSPQRVYREVELARIHRIAVLQKLGFRLSEIAALMDGGGPDIAKVLQVQLMALQRRRHETGEAMRLIEGALARVGAGGGAPLDVETLCRLIRTATEEDETMDAYEEVWRNYFSDDKVRELEARAEAITPEMQEAYTAMWKGLIADIEAAAEEGLDPTSARAAALAQRYRGLIATFTGGDAEVEDSMRRMYADKANWPTQPPPHFSDKGGAFLKAACDAAI